MLKHQSLRVLRLPDVSVESLRGEDDGRSNQGKGSVDRRRVRKDDEPQIAPTFTFIAAVRRRVADHEGPLMYNQFQMCTWSTIFKWGSASKPCSGVPKLFR